MKPFFFEVVLPAALVVGVAMGCLDVRAFVLALASGLLLWSAGALLGHAPLVSVLVTTFCLAATAQVGDAATLVAGAYRLGRQRRSQATGDAAKRSPDPASTFCTRN